MNIIPKVKSIKEKGGIFISPEFSSDERLAFCKKTFLRMCRKIYGVRLKSGDAGIKLLYDESLNKDEYKINGAFVYASDTEGASYGLATMIQLMEKAENGFKLRDTEIVDKPDKDFRAYMEDVKTELTDFDSLIALVDICWLYKVKYIQLHLMDNKAWTLPLKCFPDAATKGKSYKREEIEYLVEYANEAGVELIPEFEGIGHSAELIRNCPDEFANEFFKESETAKVLMNPADKKKWTENIMCIGKPHIFENIEKMLSEIAEIFKYSKYIHIGCDEAKHEKWADCTLCTEYMKKNGIGSTKELYSHFTAKIVDICLSLGRTPIVWEGFPKEGTENISRECIVISWENYYQTGPELIEAGFKVVNASWKPMYVVPEWIERDLNHEFKWTVAGEDWKVHELQHWAWPSKAFNGLKLEPPEMVLGGMLCQWGSSFEGMRERVNLNHAQTVDRTWNSESHYSEKEFFENSEKILKIADKLSI